MIFALVSVVASYNIYRGDCVAILDVYKYDLTKFIGGDPYIVTLDDYTYYLRMCPEPGQGDRQDIFLMQCPKKAGESCRDIITQNSLDYKPRDPKNFSQGLIYYADSEPYTYDNKTYMTLDLEFNLICDPSEIGNRIDFQFIIDDDSEVGRFVARGKTSAACPTIVASPTPTPVYEPDCEYIDRKDDDSDVGIDGDLALLNDGPFGVKTSVLINNVEKTLFYQACERMLCPPTYSCSTKGYSSAWLCDKETRSCVSYGVVVDDIDLKPVDSSSLASGMIYHMSDTETGKSINMTLTCSESFPDGHILWSDLGILKDNTLMIGGKTKEFCITKIPTPSPPPVGGPCSFKTTVQGELVSINLETYNLGSSGWEKEVRVDSSSSHPDAKLIYQPCGAVMCPANTYCDGDEDAEIWLCYPEGGENQCIGYGLWKNNVSISLYDPTNVDGGLLASYSGDNRRFAEVTIYCNESMEVDKLILPDYVTLIGRRLSFYTQAKDACPASQPSPTKGPSPSATPKPADWHPKKPSKPSQPTPTPCPSVNPNHLIFNETHYVNITLNELKQSLFEGEVLVSHDKSGDYLTMTWHPWILTDCPTGYKCDEFDLANLWTCWVEDSGTKYCHPTASKEISLDMRLTQKGDEASNGIVMDYGGGYGFNSKIVVACNIFETESIKFDDGADFTYYDDPRLTIVVDSKLACPNLFSKPTLPPTPAPTPAVDPDAKPERYYEVKLSNNKIESLNLENFASRQETVIMTNGISVIKTDIIYNPSGGKTCPEGFTCVSTEKATMWSCVNTTSTNKVCIPIADDRFGITFAQISLNNNDAGISVLYTGGYGDIESTVNFVCNENIAGFQIQNTGQINSNKYFFTAESKTVCPVGDDRKSQISGGAIFLIVLLVVCVLYVTIGVLVSYIKDGVVRLPNAAFWAEFKQCLVTGFSFIISCGKSTEIQLQSNYDKI